MMSTIEDSTSTRASLVAMGVPADLADRVRLMRDETPAHDGEDRVSLEMTYTRTKNGLSRPAVCTSVNLPASQLDMIVSDRTRMATFLENGMRATPAAQRLPMPAWVSEASKARQIAADMGRAQGLARAAEEAMQ